MADGSSPKRTILRPESYFDPDYYREEREKILSHAWLHVCHSSTIPNAGDYLTCSVAEQDIIVMRGEAGEIRAFYNVCQHRGSELLQGSGNRTAIVCPYHGWTYHTDGSLKFARGTEQVPGFDMQRICLPQLELEMIGGFVFVTLDSATPSLAATYRGFEEELRHYEPRLDELIHVRSTTFDLAVNWKVAVENYLESYHLQSVHPSLRNSCNNEDWVITTHDRHTSIMGTAKKAPEVGFFADAERLGQTNWWRWPMLMFEQMPGGSHVFTYNHIPLGPERTLQVVDFYFLTDSLTDEQRTEIDYVENVVRLEDKVVIEGWQRGLHSRGWRGGPLMIGPDVPDELTEKGILHFQGLVENAMAA